MKNNYNYALIFLSVHILCTLALLIGQTMGMHWPHLNERELMKLYIHPAFAGASILVSLILLALLWMKNEKTYRFMYSLALAACVYGILLMISHKLVFGFLLAYAAVCIIRFSAPFGWQRMNHFFGIAVQSGGNTGG